MFEPLARDGLVALALVNSMACVVPSGGAKALFGTNPIAFAAPRAGHDPLVFDLATSAMAHGDVQIAAREGRPLPEGFGVDRHGQPTTTHAPVWAAVRCRPLAGVHSSYKGFGPVDDGGAAGRGAHGGRHFSFRIRTGGSPRRTPHTGELIIADRPGQEPGARACPALRRPGRAMAGAGQQRLPGERRYRQRLSSLREGVALPAATWAELQRLAQA